MPGPRSCTVTLVQEVREKLEAVCRAAKSPQREVLRARIVLRASYGASNASIARELGVAADTVCKWRRRFARQGLAGLLDRQRSGRRSRFDASGRGWRGGTRRRRGTAGGATSTPTAAGISTRSIQST